MNVDGQHINKFEHAAIKTTLDNVFVLAKALEVPVSKLFAFRDIDNL